MRKIKLTRYEQAVEDALLRGEYVDGSKERFQEIAEALARKRKDAVLNIRVNSLDLAQIKQKAKKTGLKYQTLIAEILHRFAQA